MTHDPAFEEHRRGEESIISCQKEISIVEQESRVPTQPTMVKFVFPLTRRQPEGRVASRPKDNFLSIKVGGISAKDFEEGVRGPWKHAVKLSEGMWNLQRVLHSFSLTQPHQRYRML